MVLGIKIPSLSYSVISKYRSQLMGIAMLNVFFLHSMSWLSLTPPKIVSYIFGILFTEGFLFLSGYGIYFSYYKNHDLKSFYGKRVQRLLIPYWIMTTPFFLFQLCNGDYGIIGLVERITTVEFWTNGNYAGMWYISVSVLLYLCFPVIYSALQKRSGGGYVLLLILLIVTLIYYLSPDYFQKTSIGIVKLPYFVLGAWAAKLTVENKQFSCLWLLCFMFLYGLFSLLHIASWLSLPLMMIRLIGLFVCCTLLIWTERIHLLHRVFGWIGKYTLELYILHMLIMAALLQSDSISAACKTLIAIGGAFFLCVPVNKLCSKIIICR